MPFITNHDITELRKHDVDIIRYQPTFLKELKEFLSEVWGDEYHKDLENLETKNLDYFNSLINYPSWGAYYILEDTFTNISEENYKILSDQTKNLIGYFYDIHLH